MKLTLIINVVCVVAAAVAVLSSFVWGSNGSVCQFPPNITLPCHTAWEPSKTGGYHENVVCSTQGQ